MIEPQQVDKLRTLLSALTPKANDAEGIGQLEALRSDWEAMIADQARALNRAGVPWSEIAKPLGISRQTAHWRYAGSASGRATGQEGSS